VINQIGKSTVEMVCSWADSHSRSGSRDWYVCPDAVTRIVKQVELMKGGKLAFQQKRRMNVGPVEHVTAAAHAIPNASPKASFTAGTVNSSTTQTMLAH
jgi:hypothetical protein